MYSTKGVDFDHSASFPNKIRDLIPLTVNQIIKAAQSSDDNNVDFLIDDVYINNVKLLGMVLNKSESVTDVNFLIDDGTGCIECNRWPQEPEDTKEMEGISEGMYVRVHGSLISIQGKNKLMVCGIKRVTDFDDITSHFVECIYVHSYNTKLPNQPGSTSNQSQMPSSAFNTQTYQTVPSNQESHQQAEGLDGINQMISYYLNLPASLRRLHGVHQDELVAQLGIPLNQIQEAIAFMLNEGTVYQTRDDFHFKILNNA